jgi:hypothetical protein
MGKCHQAKTDKVDKTDNYPAKMDKVDKWDNHPPKMDKGKL